MPMRLVVRVIEERLNRLDHISGQSTMEEGDVGCCCDVGASLGLGDV